MVVEPVSANSVVVVDGELDWHQIADVVVVGTGIAGCSTALNCLERGLSVVMLEKGSATGGTSAKAAGGMMVPNNRYLQELGEDDPREDFIRFLARRRSTVALRPPGRLLRSSGVGVPPDRDVVRPRRGSVRPHAGHRGDAHRAPAGLVELQRPAGGQATVRTCAVQRRRRRRDGQRPAGHRPIDGEDQATTAGAC